jgi:hypothetical protein
MEILYMEGLRELKVECEAAKMMDGQAGDKGIFSLTLVLPVPSRPDDHWVAQRQYWTRQWF